MINLSGFTTIDIFLVWLCIVFLTLFLYMYFKLRKVKNDSKNIETREQMRWKEYEERAQRDYQEILETANSKAYEILNQATDIKTQTSTNFEKSIEIMLNNQKSALESSATNISRRHQEEVEKLNKESIQMLLNVYKDIESNVKTDFEKYMQVMNQQTFEAEKIAQERIKAEYEKLEKEIQAKRAERFQELDENIYKILSKISKDVIGKSLDFSSQEELIIKSLNEAKKEGVL